MVNILLYIISVCTHFSSLSISDCLMHSITIWSTKALYCCCEYLFIDISLDKSIAFLYILCTLCNSSKYAKCISLCFSSCISILSNTLLICIPFLVVFVHHNRKHINLYIPMLSFVCCIYHIGKHKSVHLVQKAILLHLSIFLDLDKFLD